MKARYLNHATAVAALLGAALVLACDDNGSDVSAPDPAPILRATTSVSGEVDVSISAFAAAIGAVDNKGAPNLHDRAPRRKLGRCAGPVHQYRRVSGDLLQPDRDPGARVHLRDGWAQGERQPLRRRESDLRDGPHPIQRSQDV